MHTRIMLLTIGAALLLTTCGQMRNSSIEKTSPPTPAVQEEARQPQATPEPTMTAQEPDTVLITVQEQPPKENTHQEESTPQTAATHEPVAEPTHSEDIPSETVHAKTGYVEPEPTPEPEPASTPSAPADRQAAINVANAYAVTQYGVTTDTSLTMDNSAYRFPAAVPVDVLRETLQAKARDMVDFTFHQLMMQTGVDSLADAGFRCNVCIVENGGSLLNQPTGSVRRSCSGSSSACERKSRYSKTLISNFSSNNGCVSRKCRTASVYAVRSISAAARRSSAAEWGGSSICVPSSQIKTGMKPLSAVVHRSKCGIAEVTSTPPGKKDHFMMYFTSGLLYHGGMKKERASTAPSQLHTHHQRRYSPGKYAATLRRAAERAKAETNAAQVKRGRNGLWCMENPTKRGENRISSLQK